MFYFVKSPILFHILIMAKAELFILIKMIDPEAVMLQIMIMSLIRPLFTILMMLLRVVPFMLKSRVLSKMLHYLEILLNLTVELFSKLLNREALISTNPS